MTNLDVNGMSNLIARVNDYSLAAETENFLSTKHITLMADYSSSGVWDKDGFNLFLDILPISVALKAAINGWTDWYETNTDYDRSLPSTFQTKAFSCVGYQLALDIKRELPLWNIVYFDETTNTRADIGIMPL